MTLVTGSDSDSDRQLQAMFAVSVLVPWGLFSVNSKDDFHSSLPLSIYSAAHTLEEPKRQHFVIYFQCVFLGRLVIPIHTLHISAEWRQYRYKGAILPKVGKGVIRLSSEYETHEREHETRMCNSTLSYEV